MSLIVKHFSLKLIADDTSIRKVKNSSVTEFQKDLDQVHNWMMSSKLKFLVFSKRNLRFCNLSLKLVPCCKYFGVHLDHKFSFKEHVENVRKKLTKFCGIAYRLPTIITISQLIKYYKAYVQPTLKYGVLIYGAICKKNLSDIHEIQKGFSILFLGKNIEIQYLQIDYSKRCRLIITDSVTETPCFYTISSSYK